MEVLKDKLRDAERVAILGIGNELRGDDIFGPLFAKKFKRFEGGKILVLDCGLVPENFASKIVFFNPTHLVVVDAVDMSAPPGSIGIFDEDSLPSASFSTHKPSLLQLLSYLRSFKVNPKLILLGIQPRDLSFMAPISKDVKYAMELAQKALAEALDPIFKDGCEEGERV
ncbi:hydrogenase maturation peptidase HycI [Candidatus Bathyarchaeota archaeon]|nr:hydrogenase maturation peptidase HycI [Candidatus Bathyarchaeota archaeon]MBS7627302.1 hydrogenase maturation peptidase HycI [Candidatus Bathyarchaeota archaeon]